MIGTKELRDLLAASTLVSQLEDGLRVTTQCLYPSNKSVAVTIRGNHSFVISDDAGATLELQSTGFSDTVSERKLKGLVQPQGLLARDGTIYSPAVTLSAIPAAVMLVANASKEVADWGAEHLKFRVKRNFKAELTALLNRHFHDTLKHDTPILGASNKPHKFGHVIYLAGERRLIIDPVINDPSSINSRVVANMDVKMAADPAISQLIVYDDTVNWASADLKLLELGARTVAFSQAEAVINRLAA